MGSDFAYLPVIERTTSSIAGAEPAAYTPRSTTISRRQGEDWTIVHRHADSIDGSAGSLARLHQR